MPQKGECTNNSAKKQMLRLKGGGQMDPGPDLVRAAQRAGGAYFYHRFNSSAPWEAYTAVQNAQILHAMAASPARGVLPLQLGPHTFEIRWGPNLGAHGIQQVNTRSNNTRDVKAEVQGGGGAGGPAPVARRSSSTSSAGSTRV